MNLLGKGTISAALFAATASVICAAPAQALSLTGGFTALSGVSVTNDAAYDTTATFSFTSPGFIASGSGSFAASGGDLVTFSGPLAVVNGSAGLGLNPFIDGIASTEGDLKFILSSISNYVETAGAGGTKVHSFNLHGLFMKSVGGVDTVVGNGVLATSVNATNGQGGFSATLTPVPTPAAVLPVLGGLLGMASKRKREEENA